MVLLIKIIFFFSVYSIHGIEYLTGLLGFFCKKKMGKTLLDVILVVCPERNFLCLAVYAVFHIWIKRFALCLKIENNFRK